MAQSFGMSSWDDELEQDAERQAKKESKYLRLENGSNIVRILTKPARFWQHRYKVNPTDKGWGDRVNCSKYHGRCPVCEETNPKTGKKYMPSERWLAGAIDRKTQSYKVLDISPSLYKKIRTYARNDKWGSPLNYDIDIIVDQNGEPANYYNVVASPKEPLSAADLELKDKSLDLEAIKVMVTPPTYDEVLERIDNLRKWKEMQASGGTATGQTSRQGKQNGSPAPAPAPAPSQYEDASDEDLTFPPAE